MFKITLINALTCFFLFVSAVVPDESSPCTINVWYGDQQTFGLIGIPQYWANILGNIDECPSSTSLIYSLNGGPFYSLSIGPDNRRLASPGDFNVEIGGRFSPLLSYKDGDVKYMKSSNK